MKKQSDWRQRREQKKFNIIIMILTGLLWLYVINQIAEQLTK